MRIVLDMDQILCQWTEQVVSWWNEDQGTSLTVNDIKSWDVGHWLHPVAGAYFVRSCCRYPEFYRDLLPVEGSIAGVKKLIEAGHDVVIATYAPTMATASYTGKVEWLRRNMPFFDLKNLFICHRKELLNGDVLFDDGAHNVSAWIRTKRPAVMLRAAWNEGQIVSKEGADVDFLYEVDHWNEFLNWVEENK